MIKQIIAGLSALFCILALSAPALSGQFNMTPKTPAASAAFTQIASKQQCQDKCINWSTQCQNLVTDKGDKAGWDDNTRRAAYTQIC